MNDEALQAAAEAYVAAGGSHEIPQVFLPMFRERVGQVIDALATPPQAEVEETLPPGEFVGYAGDEMAAKPKRAAKPKP